MRRPVVGCTVLVGWKESTLKTPISCDACAKHRVVPQKLPMCPRHIEENRKRSFTLVPPDGLPLVGISKSATVERLES